MRLILVEDHQQAAERLIAALRKLDPRYEITHVDSVGAALAQLNSGGAYDAALVDLGLPDARQAQAPARLCERYPELVVVALTGATDPHLAPEIIRMGAQDYLRKGEHGPVAIDRALRLAVQRHRRELSLKEAANVDELTGACNLRGFRAALQTMTDRRHHERDRELTLICLDLDGFKAVNDSHGHPMGDALLVQCARRLEACIRGRDKVARVGGDEFAILCDGPILADHLAALAHRLIAVMAEPFSLGDRVIRVSASIGIANYPGEAATTGELVQRADKALYEAKRRGKNCVVHYAELPGVSLPCQQDEPQPQNCLAASTPPASMQDREAEAGTLSRNQLKNIAHQLYNELNVVALEAGLLQLELETGPGGDASAALALIQRKCSEMALLVTQLHD